MFLSIKNTLQINIYFNICKWTHNLLSIYTNKILYKIHLFISLLSKTPLMAKNNNS